MTPFHPLTVHFPITLFLVWPGIDAVGLALGRNDVSRTALALLAIAILSSLLATVTGQAAYDQAIAAKVSPELLDTHADLASLVPWLGIAMLALRAVLSKKLGPKGHALAIVLGAALAVLVGLVGYSGGALAYEHGVGRS